MITSTLPTIAPQDTWVALYLQGAALVKAGKQEDGLKVMKRASLRLVGDGEGRLALVSELAKRKLDDFAAQQAELLARNGGIGFAAVVQPVRGVGQAV